MKKSTDKRQIKVTLVMAVSADGITARNSSEFVSWSSKADKKFFAKISKDAGAVIMGKNTFDTFTGILKDRLNIVLTDEDEISDDKDLLFYCGDLKKLLYDLFQKGFKEVVLGGGAYTNYSFYEEDLIDTIIITISPILFGRGFNLFSQPLEKRLKLLDFGKLDEDTVFLKYSFDKEENNDR